jgi:hypothetical protein
MSYLCIRESQAWVDVFTDDTLEEGTPVDIQIWGVILPPLELHKIYGIHLQG